MTPETRTALRERLSEIHRLADTGSLWLGMAAAPSAALREGRVQVRTLAREALALLPPEPAAGQAPSETMPMPWLRSCLHCGSPHVECCHTTIETGAECCEDCQHPQPPRGVSE